MKVSPGKAITVFVVLILIILTVFNSFQVVPRGHSGAASLWGEVKDHPYQPGLHFPVNPLYNWEIYDCRHQIWDAENVEVRAQDQLPCWFDITVQYRYDPAFSPTMLSETGDQERMVEVHLVPTARSLIREVGKSVMKCEDFYLDTVQRQLQDNLADQLKSTLLNKGLLIDEVLIRDVDLTPEVDASIIAKKTKAQEAERQKETLAMFTTQQREQVVAATAAREAAEEDAKKRIIAAEAEARQIEIKAIAEAEAYKIIAAQIGKENAALLEMLKVIGANNIKVTPNVMVSGQSSGNTALSTGPSGETVAFIGTMLDEWTRRQSSDSSGK